MTHEAYAFGTLLVPYLAAIAAVSDLSQRRPRGLALAMLTLAALYTLSMAGADEAPFVAAMLGGFLGRLDAVARRRAAGSGS